MVNIPKDPYNTTVKEGMKCAYNYQGQVRLGRITGIKIIPNRNPARMDKLVISVKEEMSQCISKVSNSKNLVILPN